MPVYALPDVAREFALTSPIREAHGTTRQHATTPQCLPDVQLPVRLPYACSSNALVVRLLANFLLFVSLRHLLPDPVAGGPLKAFRHHASCVLCP